MTAPTLRTHAAPLITVQPARLVTVGGDLDAEGLTMLGKRMVKLLGEGATMFVVDLAGVTRCDAQLFRVLRRFQAEVDGLRGWVRAIRPSRAVLTALDEASLTEVWQAYRALTAWTPGTWTA